MFTRTVWRTAGTLVAAVRFAAGALAHIYSSKPVRIARCGGANSILARIMADGFQPSFGQPFTGLMVMALSIVLTEDSAFFATSCVLPGEFGDHLGLGHSG